MTAQYKLLGTLEVWHNGALVPVPSGRARVLLASLLLRANEVVSVDELVDRLWEGAPTESEPSEVELVSPKVRRSPGLVPRQLPPDLPWFSGRHGELRMLDGLLPTDGTAQRTVVVSAVAGTGGVGKTAFAVHWAHRVADRFPTASCSSTCAATTPIRPCRVSKRSPSCSWDWGSRQVVCPGRWKSKSGCTGHCSPIAECCCCWTTLPPPNK